MSDKIMCICGYTFRTVKNGEAIITEHGLFSCDRLECRGCDSSILLVANSAMAYNHEDVTRQAALLMQSGVKVHQKGGKF